MNFQRVTYIPETVHRAPKNNLVEIMENFMALNLKLSKLSFTDDEFYSYQIASYSISRCVKTLQLPVKVYIRNGEVYLERTDL